ncbi:hypothetical protein [Curtobacterium flaccumfaciens]|uniref:hypothetical protein n=1 Tax=Curtobacterium flaccumfaciens TaxID=2035 RepID=UPI001BE0A66C|nr:hypothetical protein [Curtobacterium flaccumfaciens]MBT1583806.1 hypothetical protein [Curtobacterium flaccumfaciens pv. flaccumfaciens]MCX2798552.1 hypothetical protein [Curtobacterium flaccumfaciens pv. flaccumfaciens]
MHSHITEYLTDRFSVPLAANFHDVVAAFEDAVPAFDQAGLVAEIQRHSDWGTVETWTMRNAPHGFLRYWRLEPTTLMAISGGTSSCVSYLFGNHVFAQRMYRYDPRVMALTPLRCTISQKVGEPVLLTSDVPSSALGSFGDGRITAIGHFLDRELAALLRLLGASVPEVLAPS